MAASSMYFKGHLPSTAVAMYKTSLSEFIALPHLSLIPLTQAHKINSVGPFSRTQCSQKLGESGESGQALCSFFHWAGQGIQQLSRSGGACSDQNWGALFRSKGYKLN